MKSLDDYYSALERLINNVPIIVSPGTKISYDSVSLEAGKSKGSIKKSRASFTELIKKIDNLKESRKEGNLTEIKMLRAEISELKSKLDDSLAREICLIIEIQEIKKFLK